MELQLYYNQIPIINEQVLVKFISRNESHIEAILLEYNINGIMSYNNATKKKKVKNWNQLIPLNKPIVAKVEDTTDNIIELGLLSLTEKQDILLEKFNENKILLSQFKKLCIENSLDFNEFWIKIIHPIDKMRKEENEENTSLLKYFYNNFNKVEELINNKELSNKLAEKRKNEKIITKIGIISQQGIAIILKVIKKTIDENNDWDYTFKYIAAPYYHLESFTNLENHEKFINYLETEAKLNGLFTKRILI